MSELVKLNLFFLNTIINILLLIAFVSIPSLLIAQTSSTKQAATILKIEKAKACGFDLNATVTGAEQTTLGTNDFVLHSYTAIFNSSGDMLTRRAMCPNLIAEVAQIMCRATKGDKFYFENIVVKSPDGRRKKMPSLTVVIE